MLDGQLAYWREQLAGAPVLELPTDHPRPPVRSADGAVAAGPDAPVVEGTPEAVWLTAESLGDSDPALCAPRGRAVAVLRHAPLAGLEVAEVRAALAALVAA